jgi:hypothetical protein
MKGVFTMTNKATKTKKQSKEDAAKANEELMASKVKIISDEAELTKEIGLIVQQTGRMFIRIHQAAVSILALVDSRPDCVHLANHLVKGLGDGIRADAMLNWFLAFGKFGYDAKERKLVYQGDKTSSVEQAIREPFWVFTPPKEYKPVDLMEAIKTLVKRAEGRKQAGLKESDNIPDATLKALKKLVSA